MDLMDEQWSFIEPLLPKKKVREDGKGRPWQDDLYGSVKPVFSSA